jgi:hypothetical protein
MVPENAPSQSPSHWEQWHEGYEDPGSPLSLRLQLVQAGVRAALNGAAAGPIRVISMCAGQGRDVIDEVAGHPRAADVRALLVERDPALVRFARDRAAAVGVSVGVRVMEGDASMPRSYGGGGFLPADLVLACGVFGNISDGDIAALIARLPSFCAPGASVIWTRHRRAPDLTPAIRSWFEEAGFEEMSFEAPVPHVLSVGRHQLVGAPPEPSRFDSDTPFFTFTGDGGLPA